MFYVIFSYTATYLHDGLPDYSHYSASFCGHISSDVLNDNLPEALIPMFVLYRALIFSLWFLSTFPRNLLVIQLCSSGKICCLRSFSLLYMIVIGFVNRLGSLSQCILPTIYHFTFFAILKQRTSFMCNFFENLCFSPHKYYIDDSHVVLIFPSIWHFTKKRNQVFITLNKNIGTKTLTTYLSAFPFAAIVMDNIMFLCDISHASFKAFLIELSLIPCKLNVLKFSSYLKQFSHGLNSSHVKRRSQLP